MFIVEEYSKMPRELQPNWAEETKKLMEPYGTEFYRYMDCCPLIVLARELETETPLFLAGITSDSLLSTDVEVWVFAMKRAEERPLLAVRAMKTLVELYESRFPTAYARVVKSSPKALRLAKLAGLIETGTAIAPSGEQAVKFVRNL